MRSVGVTFIALLVLGFAVPAQGNFYTYAQWEKMPEPERVAYLSGVIDLLTTYAFNAEAVMFAKHYRKCVNSSKMTKEQLANNVLAFAQTNPKAQVTVQLAVVRYLRELCGSPPTPNRPPKSREIRA